MATCRISEFMRPEWVIPSLNASTKEEVLREIAVHLENQGSGVRALELAEKLLCREKKASTGADHGLAIPHATVEGVQRLIVTFARSVRGVDFGSLDNEQSHIFFTIVNPGVAEPGQITYLQAISSICRLMRSGDIRARLMKAKDSEEIYSLLTQQEALRASG